MGSIKYRVENTWIRSSTVFAEAPQLNRLRDLIKGVICGVRVENITEPTVQEIRYLDKLIDELAKSEALKKIFRKVQ